MYADPEAIRKDARASYGVDWRINRGLDSSLLFNILLPSLVIRKDKRSRKGEERGRELIYFTSWTVRGDGKVKGRMGCGIPHYDCLSSWNFNDNKNSVKKYLM